MAQRHRAALRLFREAFVVFKDRLDILRTRDRQNAAVLVNERVHPYAPKQTQLILSPLELVLVTVIAVVLIV